MVVMFKVYEIKVYFLIFHGLERSYISTKNVKDGLHLQ